MKIYISSTYEDLIEHRAAVDRTLRRMGHDVFGMEQYPAATNRPLDRCLADVKIADLYIVILGWRYGYVPADQPKPGKLSMTQLEYKKAHAAKKPILAFLLDPESPWPLNRVDAMGSKPKAGSKIASFRMLLGTVHLAGMFRTPDDLASQVAAAVSAQGVNQFMVDRALIETSVTAADMGAFGKGTALNDSSIISIKSMVARVGSERAIVVDLGAGDVWWSTRLFLLSNLLKTLTGVRQLVFRDARSRFCGMASPAAVIDQLAVEFPYCAQFLAKLNEMQPTSDIERETNRQIDVWAKFHASKKNISEKDAKAGVRADLLRKWLGERLVTRCIRVDQPGLSMTQVQQIVDSLLADVPIERLKAGTANTWQVQVVDRDAFALELAREWVRAGIPRNPIR